MKLFWSVRQLQIIFEIVVFFKPNVSHAAYRMGHLLQSKLLNPYALIDKPLGHLLGLSMLSTESKSSTNDLDVEIVDSFGPQIFTWNTTGSPEKTKLKVRFSQSTLACSGILYNRYSRSVCILLLHATWNHRNHR